MGSTNMASFRIGGGTNYKERTSGNFMDKRTALITQLRNDVDTLEFLKGNIAFNGIAFKNGQRVNASGESVRKAWDVLIKKYNIDINEL